MAYYFTVGDSMAQATTTYAAVQTAPDGGTTTAIRIPSGASRISALIAAVTIDGAVTIDTGNSFAIKLSGPGLLDGDQELVVANFSNQEVGAAVTFDTESEPAQWQPVNIRVKPGNDVSVTAAYNGADQGTPFIAVTFEVQ